ncbi:MAG: hypothetical protein EP305_06935 [Bacteroidetes bacterium]|nr:MAG: hypothetical protein EP305_06935 [Bacteroidota bacterium]
MKKTKVLRLLLCGLICLGFYSCTKDKVPLTDENELNKWEFISGTYKVYDINNGSFLYEMTIDHIYNTLDDSDSLKFSNYGNLFSFTKYQSKASNIPNFYINIGSQNPILDKYGKRWHLFQETDFNFNVLNNDTIILKYHRENMLYYISDLVQFYDTTIIEIAVKQ